MVGCVFPPIMCLCCYGVAAFLPLTLSEPLLSKQHMCLPNEDGLLSVGFIRRDAEKAGGEMEGEFKMRKREVEVKKGNRQSQKRKTERKGERKHRHNNSK